MRGLVFKNLPDEGCLEAMRGRYPMLNGQALMTHLHLLRTGSHMVSLLEKRLGRQNLSMGRMSLLMTLNIEPGASMLPGSWRSGVV